MKKIMLAILALIFTVGLFANENQENPSQENPSSVCSSNDCYRIIKQLGEGFFGKVYAVENSKGESFALKTYKKHANLSQNNRRLGDAQREFSWGQLFDHPHIIKSYELFYNSQSSEETTANVVLQLVDGQPLYKVPNGKLSKVEALVATIQFIDALRYALVMDFMHLDLHAGNIMLDSHSNVMVIDLASFFSFDEIFGFALQQLKSKTEEDTEAKNVPTAPINRLHAILPGEQTQELNIQEPNFEKIDLFFKRNPHLLHALKQQLPASEELVSPPQPFEALSKGIPAQKDNLLISKKIESIHPDKSFYYLNYFNMITDACVVFIATADFSRHERLQLRTEIKTIVWNFEEDLEEGKKDGYEVYFEQLLNLLYRYLRKSEAN